MRSEIDDFIFDYPISPARDTLTDSIHRLFRHITNIKKNPTILRFGTILESFLLILFICLLTGTGYASLKNKHYQLEDPLFESLLSEQPGNCKSIPYWGYNTYEDYFRRYALKFGHRWSLKEQYDEIKQYGLIPMYYAEKGQQYDVPFLLSLESTHKEAPFVFDVGTKKWAWIIDPRIKEGFLKDAQEKLSRWEGKGLWGLFIGDEIYFQATRVVSEDNRYDFVLEANEEIKRDYGFGKYEMPESAAEQNPFRWIAYRRWVTDKLRKRYEMLYRQVKEINSEVKIVGPNPIAYVPPDDYSGFAPFIDIMTGQAINDIKSPHLVHKLMVGYSTKVLVDLSGKPVYPAVQSCDFLGSPTAEDIRERYSQVFRNGGSGIFLLAVEWFDRELNHHKYASPLRWQAILEICDHITSMNRVNIPNDPDIALLYSSDSLSAEPEHSFNSAMLSAYSIIGPILRCWFEFVDDRQIERNIKRLESYKILIVPYAKYERFGVVLKIKEFVQQGGILIVTDPEAFSFDINGDSLDHSRRSLFGIEGMEKKVKRQTITVKNRNMPAKAAGFNVAIENGVNILGTYEDKKPAVVSRKIGKGETIYFAFNPFDLSAPEEPAWVEFWRDYLVKYEIKMGRDIWRFKFPPFKTLKTDIPKGKCLTNNHAFFQENKPNTEKNIQIEGSYSYSLSPDFVYDSANVQQGKGFTFSEGHLTNRLKAINGRMLGKWVRPADIKPWVVGWKTREPLSITFDLKGSYQIKASKIFYSGQFPEVIIKGSNDTEKWTFLAKSSAKPTTKDVLDQPYTLQGQWQYIKFSFGKRRWDWLSEQKEHFIISEIEIWGE